MAHYLIQTSKVELQAAALAWNEEGVGFAAKFEGGWAIISGPYIVGNPNVEWFEVIAENEAAQDAIDAIANESLLMRDALEARGPIRTLYKANGRRLLRNQNGAPIGVMPAFSICGRDPASSYFAGMDPEDAEELTGLE